ncbi:MAG: hypothetical protein PF439_11460 [Helicobacteraceae bacterium]|jgi:hypothetical protein|nr:hypothetical protein [Helicobacteraceae bacterium]
MKQKIKTKAIQIVQNPAAKKALKSIKPAKTLWGFFGVVLFFIAPEIIGFIWGADITGYAQTELLTATSAIERQYYDLLVMLFNEGGSWVNLTIGMALLLWLFF